MRIEGDVAELRCDQCSTRSASFTFSGDSDMVTAGLVAASAGHRHLALGQLTPDEKRAGERGVDAFAQRAAIAFGGHFQPTRVKRYEGGVAPSGTSFAEFRRVYGPAKPVYACPACDGDTVTVAVMSPAEFEAAGGVINVLGDGLFVQDR